MKEICSRARYDWVIALATSFPILEGGNVTLDGGCTKEVFEGWYRESGVIEMTYTRPQETRFYDSCWSLRGRFMGHPRSKWSLTVKVEG